MTLSITLVTKENMPILLNLAQAYEAEFSAITEKIPNDKGIFKLDTLPINPCLGYLLYSKKIPIGFCVANVISVPKDIAEFYIIPSMRRKKVGMTFAQQVFKKHPGTWQVRQIEGAHHAVKFWQNTISIYTNNNYHEEITKDPDWGQITKQTFLSE